MFDAARAQTDVDTDLVPYGTGTFGSRSIAVGGSALDRAADKIIAKAKLIAAHMLEASATDMTFFCHIRESRQMLANESGFVGRSILSSCLNPN